MSSITKYKTANSLENKNNNHLLRFKDKLQNRLTLKGYTLINAFQKPLCIPITL